MFLDLLRRERFADIPTRAAGECLHHMRFTTLSCNHYSGNVFRVYYSRELLDEFQPVHHRHVDIAKDQINLAFVKHAKCLSTIPSLEYFAQVNAGLSQRALYNLSHHRGVVNDQSAYGHEAC